jgi:phenylacetate-CoA ligase
MRRDTFARARSEQVGAWLAPAKSCPWQRRSAAELGEELARRRRELPWVPIEKEYVSERRAEELAELCDGRFQLLVHRVVVQLRDTGSTFFAALARPLPPRRRHGLVVTPATLLRLATSSLIGAHDHNSRMIFEPELETLPREQLRALQSERLQSLLAYVKERVPLYRKRLAAVEPGDIASVDELRRLPFTRKADLRDTYPFGMFAVPREELSRIHASSGTTGKLTVVGYTAADLELFARVNARSLAMAGAQPGMLLHNAYGYGLFTGGLGLHDGGERLGMVLVPVSGGMTERQLMLIEDFRPDIISCTPGYALTLAQAFRERGVMPAQISLRYALLGAEPWSEAMRSEIDAGLGVRSTNIFGLSEVIGPGVACECVEERAGSHVNEDHFLPEVVDRETGQPLPEGEQGVLVFTTLTKQALPLIRYWTGDLASLSSAPCTCGRTLVRMSRITGRADDMLIIRGVNVFPTQVEAALLQLPELTPNYRIVITRSGTLDEAEVEIEVSEAFLREAGTDSLASELDHVRDLRSRAERRLQESIGCTLLVSLKAPGTVPRSEGGKLQRVLDRRTLA